MGAGPAFGIRADQRMNFYLWSNRSVFLNDWQEVVECWQDLGINRRRVVGHVGIIYELRRDYSNIFGDTIDISGDNNEEGDSLM